MQTLQIDKLHDHKNAASASLHHLADRRNGIFYRTNIMILFYKLSIRRLKHSQTLCVEEMTTYSPGA